MKNLKELKGVKFLSKKEQQAINGGKLMCLWNPERGYYCLEPYVCIGYCVLSPQY